MNYKSIFFIFTFFTNTGLIHTSTWTPEKGMPRKPIRPHTKFFELSKNLPTERWKLTGSQEYAHNLVCYYKQNVEQYEQNLVKYNIWLAWKNRPNQKINQNFDHWFNAWLAQHTNKRASA